MLTNSQQPSLAYKVWSSVSGNILTRCDSHKTALSPVSDSLSGYFYLVIAVRSPQTLYDPTLRLLAGTETQGPFILSDNLKLFWSPKCLVLR